MCSNKYVKQVLDLPHITNEMGVSVLLTFQTMGWGRGGVCFFPKKEKDGKIVEEGC